LVGDDPLAASVEGLKNQELKEGAAAGADQAGDGVVAALAAIRPTPRGHCVVLVGKEWTRRRWWMTRKMHDRDVLRKWLGAGLLGCV